MALFNIPKQVEYSSLEYIIQELELTLQTSTYSLYELQSILKSAKQKLLYESVNRGLGQTFFLNCCLSEIDLKITLVEQLIVYLEDKKIFQLSEQSLKKNMTDILVDLSKPGQLLLQHYQTPQAFYQLYVQLSHGRMPSPEAPSCCKLFEYYKTVDNSRLSSDDFTVILYLAYSNTNIDFPPESLKLKIKQYFYSV